MDVPPKHDPRALAVAQVVRNIVEPQGALLFGSRARDDWNNASDIDILTIAEPEADTKPKYRRALAAGRAKALEIYGQPVKIDLLRFSRADFHYYRQATTHITHTALKEGISMDGEATGYGNQYEELEPNNRPDVEQRFTNCQRQVLAAETLLENGLGYEEVGQHMQRCLENALKGFLAYTEYDDGDRNEWVRSHDIGVLQDAAHTHTEGKRILGNNDFSFLTEYAIAAPYEGVPKPAAGRRQSAGCNQGNRGRNDAVHRG